MKLIEEELDQWMVRESLYEKYLENFMSSKETPVRDPIIVFKISEVITWKKL